jgi:hypothetical protein
MWRTAQAGTLATDGVDRIPDFMPRDFCDRVRNWTDDALASGATLLGPDTWVVRRVYDVKGKDTRVQQVMNAHLLNPELADLAHQRLFEKEIEARLGWPLRLDSLTVQIDDPDTETKRGWHVDRYAPPTFKAFLYLTDVEGPEHGPYAVIPGSHRDVTRKIANLAINAVRSYPRTDLRRGYADRDARLFTGPAGTCILSVQTLAHRGWPAHRERRRYVLIAYMSLASSPPETFRLGRETATRVAAGEDQ